MYNGRYWLGSFIAFLVDFFTKVLSLHYLDLEDEFYINKFFSIQRIWNKSNILASVSFPIQIWIFRLIWVSFAILLGCSIYWVSKQPVLNDGTYKTNFAKTGLFLIMGGIFGNCYDRAFRADGVIDFIRLSFMETIPIMNFADVFIYMGIISIIISWSLILLDLIENNNKKVA